MNKEHTRIILCGKAASGKDFARQLFENRNFKYAVSYTSRPKRDGEVEGKDYFFLSEEQFKDLIKIDYFYEYVDFNGWFYGTSNQQFYEDNIFIMTPSGISKLLPEDRKNSFIIYFDIPEHIRKERLEIRNDMDKPKRRFKTDHDDFKDFKDYDLRITNNNGILN